MYQFKRIKEPPCGHQLDNLLSIESVNVPYEHFDYAVELSNGWLVYNSSGQYIFPITMGDLLENSGCLMYRASDDIKKLYVDKEYGWFSFFPLSLELDITSTCNFECIHCNRSAGPISSASLDLRTIEKLANEVEQVGLKRVQILGGEPLCHPDFENICSIFRGHGVSNMFTSTNGYLVNEKTLDILTRSFSEVQISLHSVYPTVHDNITRRKGSWDRAINAIHQLVHDGVNVIISMTVMHDNFQEMKPMAEMAERVGANSIRFLALQKVGRGLTLDGLDSSELSLAASVISNISCEYPQLRVLSMGFPVSNKILQGSFWGCSAGRTLMNIKANGDVTCCSIVNKSVGSIHNNSIMELWHSYDFRRLRQVYNKSCPFSKFCGGHCKSLQEDPYVSIC